MSVVIKSESNPETCPQATNKKYDSNNNNIGLETLENLRGDIEPKNKLSWSKLYQPLFQIFVIIQRQASGESNAQPRGSKQV